MPKTDDTSLNDTMQAITRQISGEIAEADKRAKAAERKVARLEKRLAREQSRRREKVSSTRKDARGLARKSNQLETRIEGLTRELDEQRDEKLRLEHRSQALMDQVRRLSEDHHASTELFEHALQELGRRQKSVREIAHKHKQTRAELQERLDALDKTLRKQSHELAQSRTACSKAKSDLGAARREQERLQRSLDEFSAKAAAADAARDDLADELAKQAQDSAVLRETVEAEKRLRREQADHASKAATWHIRSEDGTRYGPATLTELQDWAANFRIDPGHAISSDNQHWFAAADVDALHLDWIVELEDGSIRGPFHLTATQHLIETGVITPEHLIKNVHTGELRTAASVIKK